MTGLVSLLFRVCVEFLQGYWLLPAGPESFEQLEWYLRLLLPVAGCGLIGAALSPMAAADRRVGVVHVMERLSRHQGQLPLRNAVVQFFGGIAALVAGASGGREGPAVHLGAASASLMGQALELPNNSLRVLVACGVAAAIAGSFNTPLAGVIFAMEVVVMEYTLGSFIPVIIAAVVATVMARIFFGDQPAFNIGAAPELTSLTELPFIVAAGFVVGVVATAFIFCVQAFARLDAWPYWLRALLAGAITGIAALAAPEVMGVGYDTVSAAAIGEIALTGLLLIVVLKVVSSAACVGLGLPVGTIGPTFVMGAALGGVLGFVGDTLNPDADVSLSLYVMLGMTAMMGAVLQAPLAALTAVLELSADPRLALPGMLIIVVACLTTSVVFKQKSVFLSTLETLGLKYPPDPVTRHLQRVGVAAVMNRALTRLRSPCSIPEALAALESRPVWIVVEDEHGRLLCLLRAADLRRHLEHLREDGQDGTADATQLDLTEIPGQRLDTAVIDHRASLAEAHVMLIGTNTEALCVRRVAAPLIEPVIGVITRQEIGDFLDRGE